MRRNKSIRHHSEIPRGITLTALNGHWMTQPKPVFPAPDHDHGRCAEDAFSHAERVCTGRGQKFTPIRRQYVHTAATHVTLNVSNYESTGRVLFGMEPGIALI